VGRIVSICLLCAAGLSAQETPAQGKPDDALAPLQTAAETRTAEWDTLARGLEAKVARLLPCDLRVRGAIEEVSRASQARFAALAQYLQVAEAKAKAGAAEAAMVLSEQEAFAAALSTERTESAEERDVIEGQLLDLGESVKQRAQLEEAQKALAEVAGFARQRATRTAEQADKTGTFILSLRELNDDYQKTVAALGEEISGVAAESARWNEYYAARLNRAQTECAITDAEPAPRPAPGKKQ